MVSALSPQTYLSSRCPLAAPAHSQGFDVFARQSRANKEAAGQRERKRRLQHQEEMERSLSAARSMESLAHSVEAEPHLHRQQGWRFAARRGASSHFVGSTIVVLSTYAVASLTMNFGKKVQEQRQRPNGN